jgi:hypothetical protein
VKSTNINVFSLLELSDQEIINTMKSLMSEGISINEILGDENHQYTMMHACCFFLKDKALAWMLENGAEVDMKCSTTTALGMLVSNFFSNKERGTNYWSKFRTCLAILKKHEANFDILNHEKKKPLFALLEYEKTKIPQEIMNIFFDRTTLKEKKGINIVDALLKNEINFTPANINYIVEKKAYDLNSKNEPQNSLAFSLANLPEKIFKKVRKVIESIYEKYSFKLNIPNNTKNAKAATVQPIEVAITKKNLSFFKFILEKCPEIIKYKFGTMDLTQYCAMVGFKDGLKHMLASNQFNWDNKEELVNICSREKDKGLVKKEHMKHLYDSFDAELITNVPVKPMKRMKL